MPRKASAKRLGRPPLKKGRHERVNVTLPPDVIEWLRAYGDGNLSMAIRVLVRAKMTLQVNQEGHGK